ncbi:PaaX family transcriptional regulator [Tsuneonella troitsensis]|uniref:PaaX family transcriptional regulator n=1 Tax=Tsuneonella troitsensis TaxID=292222 RepID=UPI00070A03E7|nr:PaaX family transcriptional regulator C-terminal domain-containing protein [Tsuneonella troitsensis]
MAGTTTSYVVEKLVGSIRVNPKNLIATIYGDMLVPHGGTAWLGSLVKMAQPFGISEYLSRTTALRLVNDGWLHPTRVGKLSYYSVTDEHVRNVIAYYPRVYGEPVRKANGVWWLLLTGAAGLSTKAYANLRRNLLWSGVGQVAPHVFISAAEDIATLEALFEDAGLHGRIQILQAAATSPARPDLMRTIVADAWNIAALEQSYGDFLGLFRPVWSHLERSRSLDPEAAYMIRSLLMMEYRRIALRDPRLPRDHLPNVWAGEAAFSLCRNVYEAVLSPSEAYLADVVRTADGPIRGASAELYDRFGGLTPREWPTA